MNTLEQFILNEILASINKSAGAMEDWTAIKCANGAMIFEHKKDERSVQVTKQGVEGIVQKLESGE